MFENMSKTGTYEGNFKLTLTNLKVDGGKDPNSFSVKVPPGQTFFQKISVIDESQTFKFNFSYSQKVTENLSDEMIAK